MVGDDGKDDPDAVKACCATFYESDLVASFLGDNFHPGGERVTRRLGEALGIGEGSNVLDVACGAGASAIALARAFGCHVLGIDLSEANLERARERAVTEGLADLLEFRRMDAEALDMEDGTFDSVLTECALCTFPDKAAALREMHRVLRPGGRVGITDVFIERELPPALDGLLFRIACVSGALPVAGYRAALDEAGFGEVDHEDQSFALRELLEKGRPVVMAWGVAERLYGIDLERVLGMTQERAKELLDGAFRWLDDGAFGYGLFTGVKAHNP